MRPEEKNTTQNGANITPPSQRAAAQIVRSQIDNIYENIDQPAPQKSQAEYVSPYERTHSANPKPDTDQWKKYHTAWQNYYQQYYEGYYTHHLQKAKAALATNQNNPVNTKEANDEAVYELRQQLIGKIQESATKVKKSRHFIPILSGLVVILIFSFLQFNRLIISNVMAYVSPGNIDPQNLVIDPSSTQATSADPKLIIPKINVDVPVSYDIGNDYDSQMTAMTKGVAHFAIPGASSHPGQVGNTVIAGHSSNDLLDQGDYKFIFAQLDKLNTGDTIYANYNSVRYTYTVTKKEVVKPSEISKLVYPTTKPLLTLVTCTPIGTSTNRLLVTAEQINPDPAQSTAAPTNSDKSNTPIPGNSPTLLERLFGKK